MSSVSSAPAASLRFLCPCPPSLLIGPKKIPQGHDTFLRQKHATVMGQSPTIVMRQSHDNPSYPSPLSLLFLFSFPFSLFSPPFSPHRPPPPGSKTSSLPSSRSTAPIRGSTSSPSGAKNSGGEAEEGSNPDERENGGSPLFSPCLYGVLVVSFAVKKYGWGYSSMLRDAESAK